MFNFITNTMRANPILTTGLALTGLGTAYLILRKEEQTNLQLEMTRLRREGKLFTDPSEEELARITEWKANADDENSVSPPEPAKTLGINLKFNAFGRDRPDDVYINTSPEKEQHSEFDNPSLASTIWPFGSQLKDIPGEVVDIRTAKSTKDDPFSDIPQSLIDMMSELTPLDRETVADGYRMAIVDVGPDIASRIAIKTINQILGIEEPSRKPNEEPPVFELE